MIAKRRTNVGHSARKRRGRGEGSIYQRADGTWCGTYSAGYDANRKRIRRTVFGGTKEDVTGKLARVQISKMDGTWAEPNKVRLAAYLERWLEDAAKPTIRATTYASYKWIVEKHINCRMGGVCLRHLIPVHIQGLYAEMIRDDVSARVRQLTHAVLRRALKQALKWGMIQRNPCDAVDPPRVPRREIVPLDAAQVQKLLKAAKKDRLNALYVLAIATGLRQGELFALRWCDVDLNRKVVSVRFTLVETATERFLAEPKSAKSRRQVDLPQFAVDALVDHRRRMLTEGLAGSEWVFCDTRGGQLRRSNVIRNSFKPILKRAKLRNFRFHDLRHTSATLLLAQGIHPKVVQERLGHSQISLTLDTYSHVLPTMQLEAAGKLDALLKPVSLSKRRAE
jgi:integrase